MWPFKKIRINACDRKEREIRFLGIPIFQYGCRKFDGFKESYLKIFPKSFEHKALDKIISFLPKDNTYDHVWIVRTIGLGESHLLNYMMEELVTKWKVKNPCFMSHRVVYKDMFGLYNAIPFYHIKIKYLDYALYLSTRNLKYKGQWFHVHHCTYDESTVWRQRKLEGKDKTHATETYKKDAGIKKFNDAALRFPEDVKKSTLKKVEGLNTDKFIFFAPEAQGAKRINADQWGVLFSKLKEAGFDVFVNTVSGLYPYGRSARLSVAQAVYLASLAKGIVALRSGFSEILCAVRNRHELHVIYTEFRGFSTTDFFDTYTLVNYPFYNPDNTFEHKVTSKNKDDIFNKIFIEIRDHSVKS